MGVSGYGVVEVVSNVSERFTIGEAITKSVEKDFVYWVFGSCKTEVRRLADKLRWR